MKKPPDRYPGDLPAITEADARAAIQLAEQVRVRVLKAF
jgi:hypothetical protein